MKRWIAALLVIGLAACGAVPQPFQGTRKVTADVAFVDVPSAVGIAIVPVTGMPEPLNGQFTAALAKGLEAYDIPAEAVGANTGLGFTLEGRVANRVEERGTVTVDLIWILKSRKGQESGLYMQSMSLAPAEWAGGAPGAAIRVSRDTAAAVAGIIDGNTRRVAGGSLMPAASPGREAPPPLRISVKTVDGAPGDGPKALQLATLETLLANGIRRDDVTPEVILMGRVLVEPAANGQDFMTVAWRAISQDGKDLGEVKLTNTIPRGALDGRWGPTAFAVAEAGLPQLLELLSLAPRF